MIEHKPNPVTNVKLEGKVYKHDTKGRVWLPERFQQFNPVEEKPKIKKEKKKCKNN